MAQVKISLNGTDISVAQGVTILEAATLNGVEIPTLCHDEQLEPFTSCWMCAVRLEGMKKYVPACGTRVAEGMRIWTDTDDVRAVRKMALELLLSNHRGDCVAPCKATCPAGVDVQGYIALIAEKRFREATKLVKEVNPFPLSIGRVCTRPCESECRRNAVDGPVAIDYLKRFAADWDASHPDPYMPAPGKATGKRVAAVGAGPASLTAAYYLAQKGHAVTIFEALPRPGGMLRYGIPEYRLPKATLDQEIGLITGLGVDVEYGRAMGRDFTLDDIFSDGFDAVFLGLGAMDSRKMKVPGEELDGVWAGTEFLKRMDLEDGTHGGVTVGKRVAVIGGGNTAIDAARTCLRLGAEKVTIVYRRSRAEMPAWDVEVDAAEHEGVEMHFLAAPTRIEGGGRCERLECIRMELGEPDDSGRRRPVPVDGSEFTIEVDNVIAAIGQIPDLSAIHDTVEKNAASLEAGLDLTRWGTIVADEATGATSVERVFAGGDVASGAATAIEAIAAGGRAAAAIDRLLSGRDVRDVAPFFNIRKERWDSFPEAELAGVERQERVEMPELPPARAIRTFDETELGLTEEQALAETARCLECGCVEAFECRLREYAAAYNASYERFAGDSVRDPADERHPFVTLEPEKCILCARCIRICEEVQGAAALGFFRRGFAAQMKPALDRPLAATSCESCGQCVSSCPTAALNVRPELAKPGPWALASTRSTCGFCGTGCSVELNTVDDLLVSVTPAVGVGVNGGNLCVRGRFGFGLGVSDDRPDSPLVRRSSGLEPVTWDDGLALTADGLRAAAASGGGESVAIFGSSRLTNEEAYVLQMLARAGLGTPRVGSFGTSRESEVFGALHRAFGRAASTASFDDLRSADVILLIDSDVAEEQTVAAIEIRKAVRRGARLIVISSQETRMSRLSDIWIQAEGAGTGDVLSAMIAHALDGGSAETSGRSLELENLDDLRRHVADRPAPDNESGVKAAAEAFRSAGRAVLVASAMSFDAASAGRDASLAVSLVAVSGKAATPGSGALFLRMKANGQGVTDAGLDPALLPGQMRADSDDERTRAQSAFGGPVPAGGGSVSDIFEAMERGDVRAALIVGEDPIAGADDPARVEAALSRLEFLAVMDSVPNRTAAVAHVVLPAASFGEFEGSFTNSERRIQPVAAVVTPGTGLSNVAVLSRLAGLAGAPDCGADAASVAARMVAAGLDTYLIVDGVGDGLRWGAETSLGTVDVSVPERRAPGVTFDPRFCDAVEVRLARHVEEAGLGAHVARRYGV